jgi:phospholipid N-methyltransferase
LLRSIDFDRARTIVQLGVGTGCITRELLRRLRPDARLISIEVNGVFVAECRQIRDPRLVLRHDCAGSLPRVRRELGLGDIDYIVSSLPLAIMDDQLVDRILAVSQASLAPHGMFLQYQYSLKHRAALRRRYRDVRLDFTIRNLPPAFVYACSQQPAARRDAS